MRPVLSTSLLVSYVVVVLVMLLAPLDLYTRNGATWMRDAEGISFASPGIVRTESAPARLYTDLTSGRGFTAEVWISSHADRQAGPARILSYSAGTNARNFALGQQGQALVVRLRTSRTDDNGIPQFAIQDVFTPGVKRHVVVTYDLQLLCVYVDGRRRICSEFPGGHLRTWDPSHDLLLGNEATGNRPWLGNIFLVALYNEALSAGKIERPHTAVLARTGSSAPVASNGLVALYTFTERSGTTVADSSPRPPVSLTIPTVVENVRPFLSRHSQLLSRPLRRPAIFDAVINLLLFVPFGLLACIVLEARGSKPIKAITIAIAATAAFSVGVESVQYLSVSRSSELQDVVLNILSSGIGAALYWVQPHRRQAAAGPRDGRPR